ncbi:MAG: lamin tail domain-containing protein [Schleiferiaceae bacterium]|nr:lamin tail domain-containing protein [Schleiferiaceae bacterium]
MKISLHLFLLTVCTFLFTCVNSQTVWQDRFGDLDLSSNPTWHGDTSDFQVTNDSLLRLSAPPVSSSKLIYTPSTAAWEGSWEFEIRYLFNPSTNNYSRVYIVADLLLNNGYYVQLGGNSQDRIAFYKRIGGTSTLLFQSTDDWLDTNPLNIKVKVERDSIGQFSLFADTAGTYKLIGTTLDADIKTSSIFAWECIYTSTRSDKFMMDFVEVNGSVYQDNDLPFIQKASFQDSNSIAIEFSEPLDSATALNPSHYLLSSVGFPAQTSFDSLRRDKVLLYFASPFINSNTYSLDIEKVQDLFGHAMADTNLSLSYYKAQKGDVNFSEIMFDPTPSVQLPVYEYLELYNNTNQNIDLEGWTLQTDNTSITLPYGLLDPHSYLLISDSAASFNLPFLKVDWLNGFLPNNGTTITLNDASGTQIAEMTYSTANYSNPNKADGGWSLENRDPSVACNLSQLWDGSIDLNGGTPGKPNSLNTSFEDPPIAMAFIQYVNPNSIIVHLHGNAKSISFTSDLPIGRVMETGGAGNAYSIWFQDPMVDGQLYSISLDFAENCSGHQSAKQSLKFGIPLQPEPQKLLLNEILFDPSGETSDFVEVYNASDYCLSLNSIRLANLNPLTDEPENVELLSMDSILLPPRELWVFTEDREALLDYYSFHDSVRVFECKLPSMPNDNGSIGICTSSLTWLDRLTYEQDWHHDLIADPENVSLERVSLALPTQESTNWHSASFASGFATPTLKNSQTGNFNPSGSVSLSAELITPNNDGSDDILGIQFDLEKPGWVATIIVFDGIGRPKKTVLNNTPIGQSETIIWNTENEQGTRIKRGSYLIFVELWHPAGERMKFKKPITVHYE